MTLETQPKQKTPYAALLASVKALPSSVMCEGLYLAISEKRDVGADDLEWLGNQLCRLAWEMQRRGV